MRKIFFGLLLPLVLFASAYSEDSSCLVNFYSAINNLFYEKPFVFKDENIFSLYKKRAKIWRGHEEDLCPKKFYEDIESAYRQPLVCGNKAQCDVYWQRAQLWINDHSQWRIQTVTDAIIATFGPDDQRPLAFKATKWPNEDGTALIRLKLICSDDGRCDSLPAHGLVIWFNEFVKTGQRPDFNALFPQTKP